MAHFTITLPGNRQADIRTGKIRKMNLNILQLFRMKPFTQEVHTGYIVKVADPGTSSEIHLMKNKAGKWLESGEHYWVSEGDGLISAAVKQAIDAYENQQVRF